MVNMSSVLVEMFFVNNIYKGFMKVKKQKLYNN